MWACKSAAFGFRVPSANVHSTFSYLALLQHIQQQTPPPQYHWLSSAPSPVSLCRKGWYWHTGTGACAGCGRTDLRDRSWDCIQHEWLCWHIWSHRYMGWLVCSDRAGSPDHLRAVAGGLGICWTEQEGGGMEGGRQTGRKREGVSCSNYKYVSVMCGCTGHYRPSIYNRIFR